MPDRTRERKLTADQRKLLVEGWAKGHSQKDLAEAFGISQSSVSYLVRRYTGAEPGKQVQRLMPGMTLRNLRARLEQTIDDADALLKSLKAMYVLSGAVPTTDIDEPPSQLTQLQEVERRARAGTREDKGARFDVDAVYFNMPGHDGIWTIEEFWARFPKGVAYDIAGRLYTKEEALAVRDGADDEDEPPLGPFYQTA